MTWGYVAVAGATLASAYMANDSASDANKASAKASEAELAFAQQQYDDWKAVYGPIQDNVSQYYSSLTPEYYEATGIENLNKQLEISNKQLNESFAQRGINPNSGIAASLEAQQALNVAEAKAEIRRDAPQQVADAKSRFLQIGMGNDPSAGLQNTLASQATTSANLANQANIAAADATTAAITTIGTGLADYFNKP